MKAVNDEMVSSEEAAVELEQQESDGDRKKRKNEEEHTGKQNDGSTNENDDDDIGEISFNQEFSQLSFKEREEIIHDIQGVPTWSLAEELNKLSLVERQDILFDIHGVSDNVVDETPELVSRTSKEMDEFLKSLKTEAYDLAESQSPDYLKSKPFRLMFLRAERFDAQNAAQRMIRFLEHKLELFGPTKLCKEITLNDLTPDDMECLENGHMQLMPVRDRSDRAIIVFIGNFMKYKTPENLHRANFYHIMAALEDEDLQRNGFVLVVHRVRYYPTQVNPWIVWKNARQFSYCLPFRIRGFHLCAIGYTSAFLWPSRYFLEKQARVRTRMHTGSHMECIYELMTFGIPVDDYPISSDMVLNREKHLEWVQSRKILEASSLSSSSSSYSPSSSSDNHEVRGVAVVVVVVPKPTDILFGRGKSFREHPGNLRFGFFVESVFDRYEGLSRRSEKKNFTQEVVLKIKSMGGRFLRQEAGFWKEVDDDLARQKVGHTLRSRRSIKVEEREKTEEKAKEDKKRPRQK